MHAAIRPPCKPCRRVRKRKIRKMHSISPSQTPLTGPKMGRGGVGIANVLTTQCREKNFGDNFLRPDPADGAKDRTQVPLYRLDPPRPQPSPHRRVRGRSAPGRIQKLAITPCAQPPQTEAKAAGSRSGGPRSRRGGGFGPGVSHHRRGHARTCAGSGSLFPSQVCGQRSRERIVGKACKGALGSTRTVPGWDGRVAPDRSFGTPPAPLPRPCGRQGRGTVRH